MYEGWALDHANHKNTVIDILNATALSQFQLQTLKQLQHFQNFIKIITI
jgi:hypothetical protein